MSHHSRWPSTPAERSSERRSGRRPSVLWENWQNRPSDSQIFSEEDLMSPNSYIFSSLCSSWLAASLCQHVCSTTHIPPSPQSHTCWPHPLHLWSSSPELCETLSPGLQSSICPKQNLTHSSHVVLFFFSVNKMDEHMNYCLPASVVGLFWGSEITCEHAWDII